MVIEQAHIERFGQLAGCDFAFGERLNVVAAPAGTARTFFSFLLFMLYGDEGVCAAGEAGVPGGDHPGGSLTVRVGGKRYRIVRSDAELSLTDLLADERCDIRTPVGEFLLGVPASVVAAALFSRAYTEPCDDGRVLRALAEALSGSDAADAAGIRHRIDATKQTLLHGEGRGSSIDACEAEAERLRGEIAGAQEGCAALNRAEAERAEQEAVCTEAESYIAKMTDMERDYQNVALIDTYDHLHRLENRSEKLDKKIAALREKNSYKGFHPTAEYVTALTEAHRRLTDRQRCCEQTTSIIRAANCARPLHHSNTKLLQRIDAFGGERHILDIAGRNRDNFRHSLGIGITIAVLTMVFLTIGILQTAATRHPFVLVLWIIFLILGTVSTAAFLYFAFRYRKTEHEIYREYGVDSRAGLEEVMRRALASRTRRREHEESLEHLRREEAEARERYDGQVSELSALVGMWGRSLPADGADTIDTFMGELEQDLNRVMESEQKLLSERAVLDGKIRAMRMQLAGYNEIAVRAAVPPALRDSLRQIDRQEVLAGLEYYKKRLADARARQSELDGEIDRLKSSREELSALTDRLHECEEQLDALRGIYNAYALLGDVADRAIAGTQTGRALPGPAVCMALAQLLCREALPLCTADDDIDDRRILPLLAAPAMQAGIQCILFSDRAKLGTRARRAYSGTVLLVCGTSATEGD